MNTNQQPKSDQKGKAIASLILGIISILPLIEAFLFPTEAIRYFLIRTPPIAIIGLILGIMGLKSTKRNLAIVGTVLCVISLLVLLYGFLIY